MENKTDRRTIKTKKALQNGLAVLLAEKELRKITVQEIADEADVNRVTFYKHYYDVFDLYEQTEREALSELGLLILRYQENAAEDFGKGLIEYIEKNRKLFKMIFSPHNTGEIREKFSKMIEGLFRLLQSEKTHRSLRCFAGLRMRVSCAGLYRGD